MQGVNEADQGSCRCGQVSLKVKGRPVITLACHCKGCQRMTASAFSLSALFPQDCVEVSGLETVIGGLHGDLRHHFCPHCLSWVFTKAEMFGPLVNVRASILDQTAEAAPFVETCVTEKLAWVTVPARHSYPQFPPMEDFPKLMAEFSETSN